MSVRKFNFKAVSNDRFLDRRTRSNMEFQILGTALKSELAPAKRIFFQNGIQILIRRRLLSTDEGWQ